MKAMQAIQIALKFSDGGMKRLEEMTADPLVRPGPWGGSRAMWIGGHLAVIEGRLHKMFPGTPSGVQRFGAFGRGFVLPLAFEFRWACCARLVPTMRKPFDLVAEGLNLKDGRGDWI
ncbi:MAG: hypothetical protein HZB26_22580 [Candidatus Hydrogenedentes bacterium]|nr:hypothetical protein [Candidatus Hydrogenedentota bacterium]